MDSNNSNTDNYLVDNPESCHFNNQYCIVLMKSLMFRFRISKKSCFENSHFATY